MNMKYLAVASVFALASATSAQAADAVMYQDASPNVASPAFSWTGFYVGGQIGYAWSDTDLKVSGRKDVPGYAGFGKSFSPDPSGFMGGVYAGYNFDLSNNIVLGAETDLAWVDTDDSESSTYLRGSVSQYTVKGHLKEKWAGATRVRVGYAMDRLMPFVGAGVAYSKIDSNAKFSNAAGTAFSKVSGDKTLTGYTLGAGVDYAMTDNIILRAEYRYTDFGDKDFGNANFKYNVDYKTNDLRLGVAYKF